MNHQRCCYLPTERVWHYMRYQHTAAEHLRRLYESVLKLNYSGKDKLLWPFTLTWGALCSCTKPKLIPRLWICCKTIKTHETQLTIGSYRSGTILYQSNLFELKYLLEVTLRFKVNSFQYSSYFNNLIYLNVYDSLMLVNVHNMQVKK